MIPLTKIDCRPIAIDRTATCSKSSPRRSVTEHPGSSRRNDRRLSRRRQLALPGFARRKTLYLRQAPPARERRLADARRVEGGFAPREAARRLESILSVGWRAEAGSSLHAARHRLKLLRRLGPSSPEFPETMIVLVHAGRFTYPRIRRRRILRSENHQRSPASRLAAHASSWRAGRRVERRKEKTERKLYPELAGG